MALNILGIDPSGTTGCGYAYWQTDRDDKAVGSLIGWSDAVSGGFEYDFAIVEGPWRGPMGGVAMWGLGFDAAWRLCEANAKRKFILRPKEWRGEWGLDGKPKSVIIARLRRDLGMTVEAATDDMVEAAGIAGGWAKRLARCGLKGLRRGCEVKR